jgi:F-type H+-transporting ATPase subunit a
MMTFFAEADSGIHISLKAEKLFELGPLTVTNSMLYGIVTGLILMIIMIMAARRIHLRPARGFVAIIELMTEYVINLLEGPFGSRTKAARFASIFGFYFVFIMFSNLMGLLPIVGPGVYSSVEGAHIPLFRPFTADLNGTIAMSVIAILIVQYLSIKEQGAKNHLKHYFSDKPMNPLNLFIGILEVFGELTRVLSLSLRLFLNTAVGEILIAVFTSMILASGRTPFAVIPILLFEGLVAYIQAYVFTILAGTYLGLAIAHHGDHENDHHSPVRLKNQATG